MHCIGRPTMLDEALEEVGEAAQAHADIAARRTTGKVTLDPTA
jgi:hypothetical protein